MPRPRKCRKVCGLPQSKNFGPISKKRAGSDGVNLTVDEYETIRLIDLEGLTQEACAHEMEVARSTIQSIYGSARKKIALALVQGKMLWIEGGDYRLSEETAENTCEKRCHRKENKGCNM